MNLQFSFVKHTVFVSMLVTVFSMMAAAQTDQGKPWIVEQAKSMPVAAGNNLYCAGYIQSSAISTGNRIVGGNGEAEQYNFAQNDFLYINMGRDKGVNVGDIYAVVRPRGHVRSKWSKKGDVGFYVQEVGAVEVIRVKENVAVARIKSSCDNFLLGDLVQLVEKRTSPLFEQRPPLDLFAEPSGKPSGRILMSRDGAEMLARDFVIYVDLGADDNVKIGDHLTIFRPLGNGNLFQYPRREEVGSSDYGFQSHTYKGGKFSNQAGRKSGDNANGSVVTTEMAKAGRPIGLRKVVGEAIVLNVKEKTATVLITRNSQEIHTGDWVEIQ
ncbi:MAG: hypothetical protein ACKVQJ_02390 [Pyrinomonadaceae bacterium]